MRTGRATGRQRLSSELSKTTYQSSQTDNIDWGEGPRSGLELLPWTQGGLTSFGCMCPRQQSVRSVFDTTLMFLQYRTIEKAT